MSTHLRPHSPPPQANGIGRAAPPSQRLRRQSSVALDADPFDIDLKTLMRSPDNAITDQVSLTQSHISTAAALQPALPNAVAPVLPSTASHPAHTAQGSGFVSQDPRLLQKNPQSPEFVPHKFTALGFSGLGIFGKTVDVWRVPVPDEEAANEPPLDVDTTVTLELRYDWARPVTDEDTTCALHIVNNHGSAVTVGSDNHILWTHSRSDSMALGSMKTMLVKFAKRRLTPGLLDLVPRLLTRVQIDAERPFVNGNYLVPVVRRYDGQDIRGDEGDKPALFVNFPFIALAPVRPTCAGDRKSPKHTARTLLQWRYRLQSTAARDPDQAIASLSEENIQQCCLETNRAGTRRSSGPVKGLLHVPQLWGVILSNGMLVTKSTVNYISLTGPDIDTVSARNTATEQTPIVVQINLKQDETEQGFIFPVQQCSSFLGLLNRQAQIIKSLPPPIQGPHDKSRDAQDTKVIEQTVRTPSEKYRLYTMEEDEITSATWVTHLRNARTQRIVLWLKKVTPAISVHNQPDRKEHEILEKNEGHHSRQFGDKRYGRTRSGSRNVINDTLQDGYSVLPFVKSMFADDGLDVLPFLEWPVIDRFQKTDNRSGRDRTEGHLNSLVNDILVEKFDPDPISRQPSPGVIGSHARPGRLTSLVLKDVIPSQTLGQVQQKLKHEKTFLDQLPSDSESRGNRHDKHDLKRAFLELCRNVLHWFLSEEIASGDNQIIMTFWGAVAILLEASTTVENSAAVNGRSVHFESQKIDLIQVFVGTLRETEGLLRNLRRETDSFDVTSVAIEYQNTSSSHGGVLLLSMVEAFTSVLSIFIEGARYVRLGPDGFCISQKAGRGARFGDLNLPESLKSQTDDSARHLKTARTQLIVEQSGDAHNVGLGPVVTPEAIMLLLMRRLARGVYEERTINVVEIYEKCLENLIRKVHEHADRGHLQELNSFSEEVDIISNVMKQQCDVLSDFRYTLNPQSFQAPSPFRQMHFEHECRFIDKLLRSIERQIQDCNELRDRVFRLTNENVQLVETWQDENSKSIFIFTIVTIIFLPLTFVSGFFGMNLVGISGTTSRTVHFWEVAVPLTVGISLVCGGVIWRKKLKFGAKRKRH